MIWDRGILALTLLAIDPAGLGGIVVRARSGPARDAFLGALNVLPHPMQKLHPAMDDDSLFGGIDLTETLTMGKIAFRKGLIGRGGSSLLTMAERCDPALAARLSIALDNGTLGAVVAVDEGATPDETVPAALAERLAFHIDLDISTHDIGLLCDDVEIAEAQSRLAQFQLPDRLYHTLISLCARLGVDSTRAALFTLRAARAHAALCENETVTDADIEAAAALCLAHRATRLPEPDPPENPPAPEPDTQDADTGEDSGSDEIQKLDDRILDAVMALLPDGLLNQLRPKGSVGTGSGAGTKTKSNRRGRPKPSRAGRLSGQNRLDLIATLRTAAPWQKLRAARPGRIKVLPSDFRIKTYEEKSDRLLIFAVDASGSAAIARLAEAKGAIELLLAEAYSRRDHVALISFRGAAAETLLPPTRSLVQTKKRLAALPGGGGTPLAAGLIEGLQLAAKARAQGMTPCVVLLTDGRANIALDGTANRTQATADAEKVANHFRATGTDAIVLDLGNRPAKSLADLAAKMDALYVPLPRADAHKVSGAVTAAFGP